MFALQTPPKIPQIIIPIYRTPVFEFNCPFEKISISTVIPNAKGIDEITPEIMPLKVHFFDAINPAIRLPNTTQPTKYAPTVELIIADFVKIKENISVNIIVTARPITLETNIPKMFLVVNGISFFRFEIFFRIKKPLTFNKEYEGL